MFFTILFLFYTAKIESITPVGMGIPLLNENLTSRNFRIIIFDQAPFSGLLEIKGKILEYSRMARAYRLRWVLDNASRFPLDLIGLIIEFRLDSSIFSRASNAKSRK